MASGVIKVSKRETAKKLQRAIKRAGGTIYSVDTVPFGIEVHFRGNIPYEKALALKKKYSRK